MLDTYSDQVQLLKQICLENQLNKENLLFSAWAAVLTTQSHYVSDSIIGPRIERCKKTWFF